MKVLVEGEEETGRSGLEEYVAEHPDVIAADLVVVADMGNWRVGEPTLTTSLRGVTDAVIEVSTLAGPVHSGAMGGPAPDALIGAHPHACDAPARRRQRGDRGARLA